MSKGIDLTGARLHDVSFESVKPPPNWDLSNHSLERCNFQLVDLSQGVKFTGAELRGSDFRKVRLPFADSQGRAAWLKAGVDLTQWDNVKYEPM